MYEREKKALLLLGGLGLLAVGHRLTNRELGQLGIPHLVGLALIAAATNT
jgi:hypothetical protein